MNGFSVRELCWLFCWPACPSPVAAKLAFLPPEPTSTVRVSEQRGPGAPAPASAASTSAAAQQSEEKGRGAWSVQPAPDQARRLAVLTALAGRDRGFLAHCGEQPARLHVRALRALQPLHAALLARQCVDLSQMCNFYIGLGSLINCNIFYDPLRLRRQLWQATPRRTSSQTSTPRGRRCAPGKICINEMHKT